MQIQKQGCTFLATRNLYYPDMLRSWIVKRVVGQVLPLNQVLHRFRFEFSKMKFECTVQAGLAVNLGDRVFSPLRNQSLSFKLISSPSKIPQDLREDSSAVVLINTPTTDGLLRISLKMTGVMFYNSGTEGELPVQWRDGVNGSGVYVVRNVSCGNC